MNALLTIMLPNINEVEPAERSAVIAREVHRIRQWAGRHLRGFTAIYAVESCDEQGNGQHVHVLFHALDEGAKWKWQYRHGRLRLVRIDQLWRKIEAKVEAWWGGRPIADLQAISDHGHWTDDGHWESPLHYLLKSCSPQAIFRQPIRRRKRLCPVAGPRVGWSKDLTQAVLDARRIHSSSRTNGDHP
ncbi:hypothetical protein [Fulvimarina manganoxydans]|uniref:hypothetical protein n=1 Tax=Fulvimarina manganoxydans TaxID=937218 RepID=UPI0009FC96A9|nr:hypothetical protein [Fulvimarina manganoxydans]